MEFKDYYKVLGVERTATADDIKKSFRKLARKHHPDMSKAPDAQVRMQELNEAHEVLRDPQKRAAYDKLGKRGVNGQDFRPPPDWDAGFEFSGGPAGAGPGGFSDFFEALFGAAQRRGARPGPRSASFAARGEDHHAKIVIPLEDAFRGATRTLSLSNPEMSADGHVVLRERQLSVAIPKGIRPGQQIRLAGQGEPGHGGGPAGDLFLEVQFEPHARFRVDGRDVYLTLPVAPWEAALGATVTVPTPDGAVEMTVPADSQTGRRLRLKARGIPGAPPGDFYVVLEVVLPPGSSDKAKVIYGQMAKDLAFDPRQDLQG